MRPHACPHCGQFMQLAREEFVDMPADMVARIWTRQCTRCGRMYAGKDAQIYFRLISAEALDGVKDAEMGG